MKPLFWLALLLVLLPLAAAASDTPPPAASLLPLPALALRVTHFMTPEFVMPGNTIPLYSGWSSALIAEHQQMLASLRAASGDRAALVGLLKNPDAKIRTLAMAALYSRQDGHDLPLIAELLGDSSPTFPWQHITGLDRIMYDFPQTVGDVAQAMIKPYLDAANFPGPKSDATRAAELMALFSAYWAGRDLRDHCASWFQVKMRYALALPPSAAAESAALIHQTMADIVSLPPTDRALTFLFLHISNISRFAGLISDEQLIIALKAVPPATLLDFLQHKPVTTDPDLQFDSSTKPQNAFFRPFSLFILQHAPDLLRPDDADAILAAANDEPQKSQGQSADWVAAAFELKNLRDPAKADELRRAEIQNFPLGHNAQDQAVLMAALWRARGIAEKTTLLNWYYHALESLLSAQPTGRRRPPQGTETFLRAVQASNRPDRRALFTALVADPRFDTTDLEALGAFIDSSNRIAGTPIITLGTFSQYEPGSKPPTQDPTLASWRNLLRVYYGLPEKPTPP